MKVFFADFCKQPDLQEIFLKKGHTVYVNFIRNFKNKDWSFIKDSAGFAEKYPGRFFVVNTPELINKAVEECDFGIQIEGNYKNYISPIFKKYNKVLIHSRKDGIDKLEMDRYFAKSLDLGFDKYKIKKFVSKMELEGVSFDTKYVIKAVHENNSKMDLNFRTIIPSSKEEMVQILNNDTFNHFKAGGVVLEEYIDGKEICCGMYWDGEKVVGNTLFINQEYKCVLDNNRSNILCGEIGTVIYPMNISRCKGRLAIIVDNLIRNLKTNYPNYKGFIDVNMMLKDGKFYLLEFTVRPGIPTEEEIANFIVDYPEFMRCLATKDVYKKKIENKYHVFVLMFPYGLPYTLGRKIYVKAPRYHKNCVIVDAKYSGNNKYYFECGPCLICEGSSQNIKEAKEKVYNTVKYVDDNNLIFRTDIGDMFAEPFKMLTGIDV